MKMLTVSALVCAMMALTGVTAVLPEAPPENGQPANDQLVKRSLFCTGGWTKINGRYFLYIPKARTWAQAEKNCQSIGAHLASVHSADEYHEIKKLIAEKTHGSPQTWLGASDSAEDGVWFWTDGTLFTFTYWCKGEPNNLAGQHCLQMNHGDDKCWDDFQCHVHLPSVCVKNSCGLLG